MTRISKEIKEAGADFKKVFTSIPIWSALGWNDVQGRYNRSKLGVFWASLSILIFVSAIGPIYSTLFGADLKYFMLHLMLGLIVWNYIQAIIMESGRVYINSANYMVSFQLSFFTVLARVVWRNLIVFSYQLLMFFLLAFAFNFDASSSWLLLPVIMLVITICVLWIGLLMSIFATRYRDIIELVNNLLRLGFFATPIMWMPSSKPSLMQIAMYNPFYHIIELLRAPLLSGEVDLLNWKISLAVAIAGWIVAFPLFAKFRRRIAYWI